MVFREIVAVAFLLDCVLAGANVRGHEFSSRSPTFPGEPLILTPFLQNGGFHEARDLALVKHRAFGNVRSYSGFLTTHEGYGSNTFFWYFPAEKNSETAPVILRLAPGPAKSSLYALFLENGPFHVTSAQTLKRREHSWTKTHNVIYLDSPVAAGYSFTEHRNGYSRSEKQIGGDVLEFLKQFFQLFPELQRNPFFVAGGAFAGKLVPSIAHAIAEYNSGIGENINLKGLVIENGIIDMKNQLTHGDHLYEWGLIDAKCRLHFHELENEIRQDISAQRFSQASSRFNSLFFNTHGPSVIEKYTGFNNYNNLLQATSNPEEQWVTEFIQLPEVRIAIHVGNTKLNTDNTAIIANLAHDTPQSVVPLLLKLSKHYPTLLVNGQLDMKVPCTSMSNALGKVQWSGAAEYKSKPRQQWWVGNDLAGYTRTVENLTEVLVRNAGHLVSADQPKWGLDLISRFTRNLPWDDYDSYNQ